MFDAVAAQLGPAALAALAGVIDIHKRDDALAPVTIVVPANSVGVAVRRRLARRGHGIAGVTFVTLYRLAELLGGADLAASGRQPVSNPILAAAARVALHTRPGRFAPVADHPSTELALVRAHRELDDLDAAALDRLARASGRAHDLVTLHRAMRAALAPAFSTERDLLDAASAVVASAPAARATLGAVVVYLPTTLSAPKRRLLEALMAGGAVTLVVGLTGDPTLDRDPIGVAADLGAALQVPDVAAPVASHVVSVSDPDDEARVVVRRIIDAARLGVPLERIAVVFARRDPYARLLHEHLDAAGIPHNGVAVRRLADSVAGRTLVRALALGDRDLRRGDVLAFAAGTPVRSGGRSVPAAAWERISRAAGVVAGAAQWRDRLARYRATLDDDSPEAERADGLAEFVSHLDERLQRLRRAHTWRELGAIAREILRAHLPGDHARASWSDEEQRATDKVELAIDRLATLDPVERAIGGARTPGVDLASFRRALDAELDADLGRVGRLGEGVLVGSVHLASGVELDEVYVVGLAEGSFPARWRDDSLLPDRDRAAVGDALPDRRARADADHRALLAVLAHTSGRRVFLHPRGDLRRTTDRPPSRHALDSIEALAGVRPRAGELAALAAGAGHGWFEFSPSFTAGVAATAFPATDQERRIAALLHDRATRASLAAHPLVVADRALRRGVELLLARASSEFTRFDGNLCGRPVPRLTDGVAVVSATALQRYARCPLEYLLDQILRVRMVEDPDDIERIGALDLGQIYHLALERFLAEQLASGAPAPHEPWSAAQRASLLAHARAVCDEFVAGGLTGRPVFWRYDRRRVLDDLDRFLDDDDCERRERGRTPIAAELRFGVKGAAHGPVELPLADGRTLRLRGSADRVDRTAGGGFVVIDYKTGAAGGFTDLDEANPDGNGCYLQLPIYAHATRVCHGRPDAPVEAAYRFVTQRGGYTTVAVPLTDTVADRVDHVLATIVDLIESGTFPCRMDPPDTSPFRFPSLVDPDGRSQGDRAREWQRKRAAPSLARYLALAEPDTPVALAAPGVG